MKQYKLFILIVAVISGFKPMSGQVDPNQPLTNDESVRYGVLENGLTYYIKSNQEPKERASFYIIQNVGALLEEDHQDGLAHFLEHMAFNGTRHFPGKGIIDFLERHGVAFGENINAYTSQNQTVYNLSDVPVNKPGILDTCLLILHDWSDYLLLTEEEIDAERGVIKEEWRTRRTAQFRLYKASMPYLYPDSRFAKRDVIGDLDVIENFEYNALREFYHTWYRTDLQAIAIAGDLDAAGMEAQVQDLFSSIPPVQNQPERPFYEIPDHEETIFGLVTDREADQTVIRFMIRHRVPDTGPETVLDHREDYIVSLFNAMMSQRIDELLQKGDPPFIMGIINYGDFERGYEALAAILLPKPNEESRGLTALMTELERVERYGFAQGELDRAKADLLTRWEKRYRERDKISNEEYINDYVEHYLEGDAFPSVEDGYMLVQALLPTITLEDFDEHLKKWNMDKNRVMVIQGPDSEQVSHLSEEEALAILEQVDGSEVEAYVDEALAESLVPEEPAPAEIGSTRDLSNFNAVEWTFANGARVIFRHAEFEKDQVQIVAYSEGGSSVYGPEYVPSAEMMTTVVSFYGVGEFDATGLQKMLTGKNVSLNLTLGNLSEGISGTASPRDMESLMQLIYLYFTAPRFDPEAHEAIMARYMAFVENMENNPQKIMSDSLSLILTDYHPRTRVLNREFLEDVEFDMVQEIYRERFADASDFFFVIVGNMDMEEVKTLAQKYIGAIPDLNREESWIDRGIREPEGTVEKLIPMALETPKANVNIIINQEMDYTPFNRMVMRVIQGILDLRYLETVREEEGGTYGVGVSTSLSKWPEEEATMRIGFDCDPNRASDLKGIIYEELKKLAGEGPSQEDLSKTVENILKTRQQEKEHNAYYLSTLYDYYVYGINYSDPANFEDILITMNPEDVRKVMKAFYDDPNIVDVVFVPEEVTAE
ncbi:MAG: insulinase family protein [Bacteroidetes bacterium]|nr:MAG: insulinase family protein [Bacteroidota bacterium]